MTLTSAEVAKMQKHNADLVRENETLTRDNAELRRQVEWLSEQVQYCPVCANDGLTMMSGTCRECLETFKQNKGRGHFTLSTPPADWQPPDV